jgi:hypothetical protein
LPERFSGINERDISVLPACGSDGLHLAGQAKIMALERLAWTGPSKHSLTSTPLCRNASLLS